MCKATPEGLEVFTPLESGPGTLAATRSPRPRVTAAFRNLAAVGGQDHNMIDVDVVEDLYSASPAGTASLVLPQSEESTVSTGTSSLGSHPPSPGLSSFTSIQYSNGVSKGQSTAPAKMTSASHSNPVDVSAWFQSHLDSSAIGLLYPSGQTTSSHIQNASSPRRARYRQDELNTFVGEFRLTIILWGEQHHVVLTGWLNLAQIMKDQGR